MVSLPVENMRSTATADSKKHVFFDFRDCSGLQLLAFSWWIVTGIIRLGNTLASNNTEYQPNLLSISMQDTHPIIINGLVLLFTIGFFF